MAQNVRGLSSDPLRTTVLPVARAKATEQDSENDGSVPVLLSAAGRTTTMLKARAHWEGREQEKKKTLQ